MVLPLCKAYFILKRILNTYKLQGRSNERTRTPTVIAWHCFLCLHGGDLHMPMVYFSPGITYTQSIRLFCHSYGIIVTKGSFFEDVMTL